MPLYMDVHNVTIDPDVAPAVHAQDLEIQDRFGVKYVRYWLSQNPGRVFCLAEAPNADAAVAVHRESHGQVADEIFEVQEGT